MPEPLQAPARRKLIQWALAYLAGAWAVLQVIDFIADEFGWPGQVSRIALALLGTGFFLVMVLAWFHSEQGKQRVTLPELVMLGIVLVLGVAAVRLVRSESIDPKTAATPDSSAVMPSRSLAVLPFTNLSEDKSNEYFSDGITEEILNTVARLPGLRVASRTSSFSFKGQTVAVGKIAEQLRVAHILEGSVRRSGDSVRISAKLIDVRADRQVWSSDFDRNLRDVFAVQQEIAGAIARALELQLGTLLTLTRPTTNPRAHNFYLLGLNQWNRRTRGGLNQAIVSFKAAVREDSLYAQAWAGLALAYAIAPTYDQNASASESTRLTLQSARRALALDSTLAHPHAALGWVLARHEWRWEEGTAELRRGVALNPNDAVAHAWLGSILSHRGLLAEALEQADVALALDPLSVFVHQQRAIVLLRAGRTEVATAEFQLANSIEPDNLIVLTYLTRLYLAGAQYDSAKRTLGHLMESSKYPHPDEAHAFVDALKAGQTLRARALLTGWPRAVFLTDFYSAAVHASIGDHSGALAALERSFARREPNITNLLVDPAFELLRSDPKVIAMLRRMRLQ